jgi:hypothetical protein
MRQISVGAGLAVLVCIGLASAVLGYGRGAGRGGAVAGRGPGGARRQEDIEARLPWGLMAAPRWARARRGRWLVRPVVRRDTGPAAAR